MLKKILRQSRISYTGIDKRSTDRNGNRSTSSSRIGLDAVVVGGAVVVVTVAAVVVVMIVAVIVVRVAVGQRGVVVVGV